VIGVIDRKNREKKREKWGAPEYLSGATPPADPLGLHLAVPNRVLGGELDHNPTRPACAAILLCDLKPMSTRAACALIFLFNQLF